MNVKPKCCGLAKGSIHWRPKYSLDPGQLVIVQEYTLYGAISYSTHTEGLSLFMNIHAWICLYIRLWIHAHLRYTQYSPKSYTFLLSKYIFERLSANFFASTSPLCAWSSSLLEQHLNLTKGVVPFCPFKH
jgi:hypothetical protein